MAGLRPCQFGWRLWSKADTERFEGPFEILFLSGSSFCWPGRGLRSGFRAIG